MDFRFSEAESGTNAFWQFLLKVTIVFCLAPTSSYKWLSVEIPLGERFLYFASCFAFASLRIENSYLNCICLTSEIEHFLICLSYSYLIFAHFLLGC